MKSDSRKKNKAKLRVWQCGVTLLATLTLVAQASEPYLPDADSVVLERVASKVSRVLREQREALTRDPQNLALATAFARRAISLGRAEGDPRYFGYAQSALMPWWALGQAPAEVVLMRATLLQQRHDFDAARSDLDRLLAQDPGNAQARLTRAVINQVQGRLPAGQADCTALLGRSSLTTIIACTASVTSLTARAEASYQGLQRALEQRNEASEESLWAQTLAAELGARLGKTAQAEAHFRAALAQTQQSGITDPYLLTAYADFLLAQNRPREVIELLRDWTRVDNALLRLTLAEQALNNPGDRNGVETLTRHKTELEARFAAARTRGETAHQREEALYALHLKSVAADALELARQNWIKQREALDAAVYLEAADKAGKPKAAAEVLDWMNQNSITDPQLRRLAAALEQS